MLYEVSQKHFYQKPKFYGPFLRIDSPVPKATKPLQGDRLLSSIKSSWFPSTHFKQLES